MYYSNLLKQIKKQLRQKKRRFSFGVILMVVLAAAVFLVQGRMDGTSGDSKPSGSDKENAVAVMKPVSYAEPEKDSEVWKALVENGEARHVLINKIYVCGEETEDLGLLPVQSILDYHAEHPGMDVTLDEGGTVRFSETIADLSARCKDNAYFGLDKSGNLSLFDGLPVNEKVIRTFFQLNVEHLKSSLPAEAWKQLYAGIRVSDLEEYNSVISTFSDFAQNLESR